MNSSDGASVNASTAAGALGVVEKGKIVIHCDRAVGAGACALGTSDTAIGTHLAGKCTLIVVGTADSDDSAVLLHLDGAVRTGLRAKSAARAEARNDLCYAVMDDDGIVGANSCTVAETDAGEGTNVFAFPMLGSLFTSFEAVTKVLFILLGSLAGTVASNVSKELDSLTCLDAED